MASMGNEGVDETEEESLMEVVGDNAINYGENVGSKESSSSSSSSDSAIVGAKKTVVQEEELSSSSSSSIPSIVGERTEGFNEAEGQKGGDQSGEGGNNSSKNSSSGFGSNWHERIKSNACCRDVEAILKPLYKEHGATQGNLGDAGLDGTCTTFSAHDCLDKCEVRQKHY